MADVSPAGPSGGGGRVLGLRPRTALIIGGVVLIGAVAFLWWRRRSAGSTAAASSTSTAAGGTGIDYGGELSVIQSELESLLAAQGVPAQGSGGGTTTTAAGGGGLVIPMGTGEGPVPAGGGNGTGGGGQPKPKPGTPTGVHATRTTGNSVGLAWNKSPNAGSYWVRVTYQGKLVTSQSTGGTSVTISGLKPDRTYTMHVAAVGPGGTSAETNGPAVKTSK